MRTISTTVDIDALPSVVWDALTDFARLPEWSTFIRSMDGPLELGRPLKVRLEPPGGRAMTFRPTVVAVDANHRLAWRGKLGIRGLFDGEHSFTLEPLENGRSTRFVHAETFSGLLVPIAGRMLAKTETGFEQFNAALKQRAEATAARAPTENEAGP